MNSRGHRGRIDYQLRNYVCAHMKRNDPISRRFIQHVSMQTSRMFILVRDGTTGQIIASPDEEELWLTRLIIGRSPRDESIQTTKYVGEEFFEEMDAARNFHLGFADFYDVYIWNADAGGSGEFLHASISEVSCTLFVGTWKLTTYRCCTKHIKSRRLSTDGLLKPPF